MKQYMGGVVVKCEWIKLPGFLQTPICKSKLCCIVHCTLSCLVIWCNRDHLLKIVTNDFYVYFSSFRHCDLETDGSSKAKGQEPSTAKLDTQIIEFRQYKSPSSEKEKLGSVSNPAYSTANPQRLQEVSLIVNASCPIRLCSQSLLHVHNTHCITCSDVYCEHNDMSVSRTLL